MKRAIKRWSAAALTLLLLLPVLAMTGAAAEQDQAYAYVYDAYGNANESPAPYQTEYRIDVDAFGIGALCSASGVFVRDDFLYICDSGNNRIIQLELKADGSELVRVIEGAANVGDAGKLKGPTDVFVTEDGDMVIADYGNNRILRLDDELNLVTEILRPEDATVDQTVPFKPNKLVVTANHIYVQTQSVNKGLIR